MLERSTLVRAFGASRRGIYGEGPAVGEEVEKAFAADFLPHPGPGAAVVQEEAGIQSVGEVDVETQPLLLDDEVLARGGEPGYCARPQALGRCVLVKTCSLATSNTSTTS